MVSPSQIGAQLNSYESEANFEYWDFVMTTVASLVMPGLMEPV